MFFEPMTTIIAAATVTFMLIMIMVISLFTYTFLHFKNKKEQVLEPKPDENTASLQTSPQASSVEMEVKENASSIIPKKNVAYETNQIKKRQLLT